MKEGERNFKLSCQAIGNQSLLRVSIYRNNELIENSKTKRAVHLIDSIRKSDAGHYYCRATWFSDFGRGVSSKSMEMVVEGKNEINVYTGSSISLNCNSTANWYKISQVNILRFKCK